MTPIHRVRLLANLANADYGTAEALDLVEELLDRGCPLERIDAALDEQERRAPGEARWLETPWFKTRGWLGPVFEPLEPVAWFVGHEETC